MDRRVALVRKLDFWIFELDFLELDFLELDFLELDFLELDFLELDFLELDFRELDFLAHDGCMGAPFPVHVHDGIECA